MEWLSVPLHLNRLSCQQMPAAVGFLPDKQYAEVYCAGFAIVIGFG
jgi:hypothetical protein